jgi:hypothetical protein
MSDSITDFGNSSAGPAGEGKDWATRYFRLKISDGIPPAGTVISKLVSEFGQRLPVGAETFNFARPILLTRTLRIASRQPADRRPAIGRCLYCPATTRFPGTDIPLSEGHAIPEGLGASLILPEASCKECVDATGAIEGNVLNLLFGPSRRRLGIRGKKQNAMNAIFR